MTKDISFYEVYLTVTLHELRSPKASDKDFIHERAAAAEEEAEVQRLAGLSPEAAHECAIKVLVAGIGDMKG